MTLTNYWWLLIWLFTGGAVLAIVFPKRREIVMGRVEERWSPLAAVLLVAPYIVWAGFRSDSFGDTGAYRAAFMAMPNSIMEWPAFLTEVTKDKGFTVLSLVIKIFIGNSSVSYFLIVAALQILILVSVYRKYSCNYWMSIFLFIATTDYISWVENGIRQFVAVTIIFAATGLLLRKKYISVILFIFLASTMHQSALLMIPIIFIIQGKAWNQKTILCILASIVALVFIDQFTSVLDILLTDTQYTNVVSDWQGWDDDGMNPIRVLVYAVPTILSLVGYKQIKIVDEPVINMAVNASIVSTAFALLAIGTSGIFIGRLPIYVSLYATGILLPWELDYVFTENSARFVKICATVLFVIFFWYQMHIGWAIL